MHVRSTITAAMLVVLAGPGAAMAVPVVVDFEDITLPAAGFIYGGPGTAADGVPQPVSLVSGSVAFVTTITRYAPNEWWSGFAFSNRGDTTTGGWTNQYSSFTGGGSGGGGNFAIAYWQAYDPDPVFNLPAGMRPVSMQLANTTYTALTMRDGDVENFSSGKYGAGDYLSATFTGHSLENGGGAPTGAATFFLADFRAGRSSIIDQWTGLDLAALGEARSVSISFASSDTGDFGINTPTYVAIDNLMITSVPEPSTWAMLAGGAAWVAWRRRAHRR